LTATILLVEVLSSVVYHKISTISRTIVTCIWWPEVGMRLIYKTNSTTNISSL